MFQEVQLAFSMLTVDAESIEALEATESFISSLPTPAVSPARKPTKIRIGDGVLFLGDVQDGQPHGVGEMLLKDGAVHHGTFDRGRAEGLGVFYAANGSVFRGHWAQNRRTGPFEVLDPKGGRWHDLYDEHGKRVRRTQALVKAMEAAAEAVEAAKLEAAAAEARAAQAKAAVAAAEAAVALAQARPPPPPRSLSALPPPPAEVQLPPSPGGAGGEYKPLTAEQRRANAERRRLAGAAIRAEQRRREGGGFAGVGSPTGGAVSGTGAGNGAGTGAGAGAGTGGASPLDSEAPSWASSPAAVCEEAAPGAHEPLDTAPPIATSLFADGASVAVPCRECGVRFHPRRASRCRRHHMEWMAVPPPVDWKEWPEGGLWRCCSRPQREAEGCALGWHVAAAPAPAAADGGGGAEDRENRSQSTQQHQPSQTKE